MPDDLLQQLAGAGMTEEQLRQLSPAIAFGRQMMQPQEAQGRQVGNTYVAASPLEHLSNAIRQMVGAKMASGAINRSQQLLQQQQQARQGFMGALQTAQAGGQGGTLGTEGGGMARPPDPQAAQKLMMAGAGSGDPALQQMAHFGMQSQQLERQNRVLENTLRHQQVLEGQGQGRLDLGQERIDAMNQALALRGIRYDPNTNQFVDIRGMAGVPKPGKKSVLPRSTGNAAPAAPAAAPPPSNGGGGPPPGGPAPGPLGKWQDKALKDLGADFNPSSGRSGEFGKNQARVNSAKRLLTLAEDPQGNPRDLNPQQMPELSQALAGLIGGSAGAQAQIEHLTPHSISGDYAKIAQWLTNEPHGSGQQAFVKNMIETAKREQSVAQQGIEQVRGQLGAKHQRILRSNPEESRKVLRAFGWDLGPDGLPVQQQTAPQASTATGARKFTRQNGKLVEVTDAH